MSRFLLFGALCALSPALPAQVPDDDFADLFDLYIMDDYEKCLKKALKYTESDKTKNSATPWLYVTISYYKMSTKSEFAEKYPTALEDALKSGVKYRKKDKSGKSWEKNQAFFDEMKAQLVEKFTKDAQKGQYKDAGKTLKRLVAIDDQDHALKIITGVILVLDKKTEGLSMIETALDSLKAKYDGKKFESSKEKEALLALAFAEYSVLLLERSDYKDLARNIIETGRSIMKENEEVQRQYQRLSRDQKL